MENETKKQKGVCKYCGSSNITIDGEGMTHYYYCKDCEKPTDKVKKQDKSMVGQWVEWLIEKREEQIKNPITKEQVRKNIEEVERIKTILRRQHKNYELAEDIRDIDDKYDMEQRGGLGRGLVDEELENMYVNFVEDLLTEREQFNKEELEWIEALADNCIEKYGGKTWFLKEHKNVLESVLRKVSNLLKEEE
jgi:hypothetical protein